MVGDPSINGFAFFENMSISTGSNINDESYDLATIHCGSVISDDIITNNLSVSGPVVAIDLSVGGAYGSVFHIGDWDIEEDARGDLVFKNNGIVSFRMRKPSQS